MLNFLRRLRAIRTAKLLSSNAEIYFAQNVLFFVEKGATISVNGKVTFGFPLPGIHPFPSYNYSVLSIKKGGKLIFGGDTFIANGCGIYIDQDATLEFKGNNRVAHNSTLICKNKITYGLNSSSSWCLNAIDDDGHLFHTLDGVPIHREKRPLEIGDNVAIQINVTIPRAISIGSGSIVGANTVLRRDVPENVRVYENAEVRTRDKVTFGFQFQK